MLNTAMKTVLYVAGDENIILPSLFFFKSIREYNAHFPLYIFTETKKISQKYKIFARNNSIEIIDTGDLDKHNTEYIEKFSRMGRWPRHVFYNWLAPRYFHTAGFDYAIKADYDMLCLNKIILSDIIPDEEETITVLRKAKIKAKLDEQSFVNICSHLNLDFPEEARSANVGLVVFNLYSWNKLNLEELYINIYLYLKNRIQEWNGQIKNETIEQLAFACLQGRTKALFKSLPEEYNYRPIFARSTNLPVFVHYNTPLKPWHEIDYRIASKYNPVGVISQLIMNHKWQTFAAKIDLGPEIALPKHSLFELKCMVERISETAIESGIAEVRKKTIHDTQQRIKSLLNQEFEFKTDPMYRWTQVPISADGKLHFEVLLLENIAKCVIHFEGKWKDFSYIIENLKLEKICNAKIIKNISKGEYGYILQDLDYRIISNTFIAIYLQLKPQLHFVLKMHREEIY